MDTNSKSTACFNSCLDLTWDSTISARSLGAFLFLGSSHGGVSNYVLLREALYKPVDIIEYNTSNIIPNLLYVRMETYFLYAHLILAHSCTLP